jgi:flagellar biosynthesis/type III secretory pathway protein FliH
MEATTKIIEEVQKGMAERYDKEFNEIRYFVDEAYELGLADGKAQAKAEIINLINGDKQ